MNPFKSQKPLSIWLSEYAISHQNTANKRIHYICVPIIFLTIVGLLYHISGYLLSVITIGVLWFYIRLSLLSFIAMLGFYAMCLGIVMFAPVGIWFWIWVFILAWIGQFIGHKIERAKPSFFKDLQFLLIGPLWVAFSLLGKIPVNNQQTHA